MYRGTYYRKSEAPFNAESLVDELVRYVAANDIDVEHQAAVASLKEKRKESTHYLAKLSPYCITYEER